MGKLCSSVSVCTFSSRQTNGSFPGMPPCWQFAEEVFRKVLPYLVFSHLFDTDQCMTHLRSVLFATGQTTDDCFYFTALIMSAYKIYFNSSVLRKCWPVELFLKHSQYRLNLFSELPVTVSFSNVREKVLRDNWPCFDSQTLEIPGGPYPSSTPSIIITLM
ncbi:uncharacterized protein LAJ45_07296 [Morchella importuna]|uniref:uncharacterized protein n=1 Tax=Morchella importuna TaxID=1174673 RepID=UPI001E8ED8B3|nr:uncharacterized protein LAJ45_07296 [Morchella importuna]KAH8148585.1 hypothetical protein LAJ45_07296 [Morchella importuna]